MTVLLGLVQCEDRRTMTAWLRTLQKGISVWGLSRFLAHAPWFADAVSQQWWQSFRSQVSVVIRQEIINQVGPHPKRRGRPKRPVVTGYLIFDDSVQHKPRGQKMGGLGLHYSSTERRVVKGHNLVQGMYVVLGRQCPLAPKMYRTCSACEREGVAFVSKINLVVASIAHFDPFPDTQTMVLLDSWYLAKSVWKAARTRGFAGAGGAKKNRSLRRKGADGTHFWQSFAEYAQERSPEDFQYVTWPSETGEQTMAIHPVRTRVRGLGACQVAVVRPTADAPAAQTRFFVTSQVQDSHEQVAAALAARWKIETFFEDLKDVLGIDQYQVMQARAILRIWTLACCLYACLEEYRASHLASTGQRLTIGQVRRQFQSNHHLFLLCWLRDQFAHGATPVSLFHSLVA